ncbi:SbmA/BacA-like family transporter [Xanthobacter sp. KR7-225]|uniref:SbmA/BacA-like family transporter n=1 Tax=Xanthobacter sp. KR7-225 TaxID=3156613 RepID=UPI0032B3CF15
MAGDMYHPPDQQRLLSRFLASASGYWRGRTGWRAWCLVVAMVAIVLLQLWAQYRLNFWNRDFFDAIGRKDGIELWRQAMLFVPLAAASISFVIVSVWVRMTIQRQWRASLSNHLYDYWLGNNRYRQLRFMLGEHQTPEYRIAEDAKVATDVPVDLAVGLLSSFLNAITFIGVLWTVGGSLVITVHGHHVSIPGYLVLSVIAYSALVTAAMMLIGRHLMRVLGESKRVEADLRAIGAHLRESGEAPALDGGERGGRALIGGVLAKVIFQWRQLCFQLMRMTLVSQTNLLLTPVIGLLLCMPKYLVGLMSLGEVIQAAAAFTIVQAAFNWITDSYARMAEWRSSANRVASLLLALDQIGPSERSVDLDMTAESKVGKA